MTDRIKPKEFQNPTAQNESDIAKSDPNKKLQNTSLQDLPTELGLEVVAHLDTLGDAINLGRASKSTHDLITNNSPIWSQFGVRPPVSLPKTMQAAFARQVRQFPRDVQAALNTLKVPLDVFSNSDVERFTKSVREINRQMAQAQEYAIDGDFSLMDNSLKDVAQGADLAGIGPLPLSKEMKSAYLKGIEKLMASAEEMRDKYYGYVPSKPDGYHIVSMIVQYELVVEYAKTMGTEAPSLMPADKMKLAYVDAMKEKMASAKGSVAANSVPSMLASLQDAARFAKHAGVDMPSLSVEGARQDIRAAYYQFLNDLKP